MKSTSTLIRNAIAFTICGFMSAFVWADGCGGSDQAPCPVPVERVDITGSCGAECAAVGTGGSGFGTGGDSDPWVSAANSAASSTADKAIKLVKKVNTACKSASESCEQWAQRMLTPAGAPVLDGNAMPTGKYGIGICSLAGFSGSVCHLNITEIAMDPVACGLLSCPAS